MCLDGTLTIKPKQFILDIDLCFKYMYKYWFKKIIFIY